MIRNFLVFSAILAVALTSSAAFGQVWNEAGDAPAGVPARQDTVGAGPLLNINGVINASGQDWVDTYSIIITDPNDFYATTAANIGRGTGFADFDTRLWLWELENFGLPTEQANIVMGNDDTFSDGLQSTLSDAANFNGLTGGAVSTIDPVPSLQPGKYLLSIGAFNDDPLDANGIDLVQLGTPNLFSDLVGPNVAAGPFANWSDAHTAAGDYSIELGGATYCVPEPMSLGLLALGFMGLLYGVRLKK